MCVGCIISFTSSLALVPICCTASGWISSWWLLWVHVACIFQYLNFVVGRESINSECLSFHYFSILKNHHFQWLLTSIFFNFSKLPQSHKLRFMVKQTLILKLGFLWNILVRVDQIGLWLEKLRKSQWLNKTEAYFLLLLHFQIWISKWFNFALSLIKSQSDGVGISFKNWHMLWQREIDFVHWGLTLKASSWLCHYLRFFGPSNPHDHI